MQENTKKPRIIIDERNLKMEDYAVYIQNAYKSYGSKPVLSNLCMKVPRGSIYGLLGASGCGKTTLLSCIVGRKKLQNGDIYVLGGKPGTAESGVPGVRVGYMPQDIALVAEFTVKGSVYYFGRIYNMNDELIEERYQKLKQLLDLPPDDRFIKNCSGGQQRRVSFAAAMVHKPELLILDEPTVGLDPVLRDRIWNYLVEITQKEKIAVIITTHYIEEASQANKIGLLRGGRLLAEESPEKLLELFGTDSLEEVFLNLSKQQEDGRLADVEHSTLDDQNNSMVTGSTTSVSMVMNEMGNGSREVLTKSKKPKKKVVNSSLLNKNRFKALLAKNWMQYSRNLSGVAWTLFFPVLEVLVFALAIGTDIKDVNIGIINDENMNNICDNLDNIKTAVPSGFTDCNFTAISCRFVNELDHPMLHKVRYDSLDKAYDDIRSGKIVGVLFMESNFTKAFEERLNQGNGVSDNNLNFSQIQVWLDLSNRQVGYTIKYKLYDLYQDFQKKLFKDCNYFEKFSEFPVRFETPVYGKKNETFSVFMVPGVLMSIMFFMGTTMTSTIIISDRMEGVWDRSIVAGVTIIEIMLTHLITQFILIIMQVIEVSVIIFWIFKFKTVGSIFTVLFMTILQGLSGMCFGFWISVISDNHNLANMASTGSFYPMLLLCGLIWPIEAQPTVLRWISKALPFTIPIVSLRNVMHKGWSILHLEVINGVCIEIAWIIFLAIVSGIQMKSKR